MKTSKVMLVIIVVLGLVGLNTANAAQLGVVVNTADDIPIFSGSGNFPTTQGTLQFWAKDSGSYVGAVNPRFFGYVNGSDSMEYMDLRNPTANTVPTLYNYSTYSDTAGGYDGWQNVYGPAATGDVSNWMQVTITWDQGLDPAKYQDVWTYIDGVKVGRSYHHSGLWAASGGTFAIGGRTYREAPGHMTIDEVRIKNTVLLEAQVLADYQQMAVSKLPLTADAATTFLAHFDSSPNADFGLGGTTANFGGASTGVLGTGYQFVPEPATIIMLSLGSLSLLRRKRKKS